MFGIEEYQGEDRSATPSEACREFAYNVGYYPRYINHQWLLTDMDSWERNPHYRGPDQRHPEDDYYDGENDNGYEGVPDNANDPDIPF
jgi:hypothetical protein